MMKNAVLTVSHGSVFDAEKLKTVTPIACAVEDAFEGYTAIHAFVNESCISALRQKGLEVYHYAQAVESAAKGFDNVYVIPLLLTAGKIYSNIVKAAQGFPVSEPLMHSESDCRHIAQIYEKIANESNRDLILVGHGSVDTENEEYMCLSKLLPEHVHIACLKGKPGFDQILSCLSGERCILLMPLMISAGRHAREEMAGSRKDSWKNILENQGFDVQVRGEGLEEMPEIQEMFIEKARKAARRQS